MRAGLLPADLRRATLTLALLATPLSGCNLVLGASDYRVGATGTGGATTSSSSTGTGSSMTTTSSSSSSSASTSSTGSGGQVAVSVYPTFATLPPGGSLKLLAIVGGAKDTSVTWASTMGSVAGTGASATYVAPMTPGMYTVTATSVMSPSQSASATVTVTSAPLTHGMNVPTAHPRIFWTPDRLMRAKAWWAAHSFPPPNDPYRLYESIFGYVASGGNDPMYCQLPISSVLAWSSTCTAQTFACDDALQMGEIALLTYDWCNSLLTPTQASMIQSKLNAFFDTIRQEPFGGVGYSQNAYYMAYLRGELEWALASYPENAMAAEGFLDDALVTRYANDFLPPSLPGGAADGGLCASGSGNGALYDFFPALTAFPTAESLGRDVWNETPYWKGAVFNRIYLTPPKPTLGSARPGWDVFPFAGDEYWANGAPAAAANVGDFMTTAAAQWDKTDVGQYARQWLSLVSPQRDDIVLSTDPSPTSSGKAFSSLPLDDYDPGPRYLVGRSSWTSDATSYLFQMGDLRDGANQHSDWGTLQINRNGHWLTRETPTYFENVPGYGGMGLVGGDSEFAHNVPLVNGMGGVPAGGPYNAAPVVRRLASTPHYAYADVDLSGVYRNDQNPMASNTAALHVERELVFLRDLETFVVLDRLQSDTPARTKTFLLHCETKPTMPDASHVSCVNVDQELYVSTLLPAAPASRTIVDESCCMATVQPQNAQFRVEINDAPNAVDSYLLHVLQAKNAGGAPLAPSVVDSNPGDPTSGTLTVTIDASDSVVFQKGTSSTGGTLTVGGGSTPLRADVQGITVTDLGPLWSP